MNPIQRDLTTREICKQCYQPNPLGFAVPDSVWEAVVPDGKRDTVLCLPCFVRHADEKLFPWDEQIDFYPVSLATHHGLETHTCVSQST